MKVRSPCNNCLKLPCCEENCSEFDCFAYEIDIVQKISVYFSVTCLMVFVTIFLVILQKPNIIGIVYIIGCIGTLIITLLNLEIVSDAMEDIASFIFIIFLILFSPAIVMVCLINLIIKLIIGNTHRAYTALDLT